ncbi:M48 family metallopeptidase [soil metagenome]
MDFFDAQDRAKRNTGKLLALYLAAVILIIASVYIVSLFALGFAGAPGARQIWQPGLFFFVSVIVLILIISGTLFRITQLRKGGSAVAEMLGGRKAEPSSNNAGERRLINIVEEMSIASGLPVPDIYILDQEENINAFAAGFGTDDAAVGVTRGAIDQLSRDELQGVIAHEFSHIFNGDMRLNIRLIGILNGILLLHIMGMILMRGSLLSGGRMRRSGGQGSGGGGGQAAIAMILLGVALIVIGYIGMLFGRMIQAAVSRQREYLADAAAVQYTRNPDGIAGALEKIGRTKKGGKIEDGHAMELSHLFFASSFHTSFDKLFATHPPLNDRIAAIRPGSDPEQIRKKERIDKLLKKDRIERQKSSNKVESKGKGPLTETLPGPEILLAAIGTMDGDGVNEANTLLKQMPDELIEAAHEPLKAEAIIYTLLLINRKDSKYEVPEWCIKILDPYMCEQVAELLPVVNKGKREWSLPLAEISMPALRKMSENQYRIFRKNLNLIIEHDLKVSLFEFAIEKLVERRLDIHFNEKKNPKIRHHHLKTIGNEISIMLSALANSSKTDTQKAWRAGVDAMKNAAPDNLTFLPRDEYTLKDLDKALDELSHSANPIKRYLMSSMIHCVLSDEKISIEELELLRAISESIGCPIPLHVMPR